MALSLLPAPGHASRGNPFEDLPEFTAQAPADSVRGILAAMEDPHEAVVASVITNAYVATGLRTPEVRARLQELARSPLLIRWLGSRDPLLESAALKLAASLGQDSRGAEQASRLAELLKSSDPELRMNAVRAMEAMGAGARSQAPQLAALLKNPGPEDLRRAAAEALAAMKGDARAQAPVLAPLLKDPEDEVRRAVAEALVAMGPGAREQVPVLVELLKDPDADVRAASARVLGAVGGREQGPRLFELLKDPQDRVRISAAHALGALGAEEQGAALVELLKDGDEGLRSVAARALAAIRSPAQAALFVTLLKDANPEVRDAAERALISLGERAREQAPRVAQLLSGADSTLRASALAVLGRMKAREQAPRIAKLLDHPDSHVRYRATMALGEMGATEQAPRLVALLEDPKGGVRVAAVSALASVGLSEAPRIARLLKEPDEELRSIAAKVLGLMGAVEQAPRIAEVLNDPIFDVRSTAAYSLGQLGAMAQAPRIAELLKDPEADVREVATSALGDMKARAQMLPVAELLRDPEPGVQVSAVLSLVSLSPLDAPSMAAVIALILEDRGEYVDWLTFAHVAGGGDPTIERVLRWSVRRSDERPTDVSPQEARATLVSFRDFWPHAAKQRLLRDALADSIATVARLNQGHWSGAEDLKLLESLRDLLRQDHPLQADSLQQVISGRESWSWLMKARWALLSHLALWIALVFVYPYSPRVQALFFWNPWVRNLMGFVYVGLLLTWVPFLRRRLFSPFAQQLTADAGLEDLDPGAYFERSEVVAPATGKRERLLEVLPQLHRQIILEGASGLGKTMFLRRLLSRSKRLAVYLTAERCDAGVLEAIQAKLEGHAKDGGFLRSLIHGGALDIYIDGLNEVTADTRARIVQFMEGNSQANILLSTQRLEWTPPATARVLVLQPLADADIAAFLVGREPFLEASAVLRGAGYVERCHRFVAEALSPEHSELLRRSLREVLSNPMDLTVVAQMLADGQSPDLSNLRQQQYALMARDYSGVHLTEFPLGRFSEEAYQMRKADRTILSEDDFSRELLPMERSRMVLKRLWRGPDGRDHREWRFRHDKIQEFFIAQTFLSAQSQRELEHLGDPRFRGVYLLLVALLPLERARVLRDLLVVHAAETGDHAVSDDYVKLLKTREAIHGAREATARDAGAPVIPLHGRS
ncbi:HEAT repeat domain-containing protein [Corallococcus sp. BB11-1]|uniref:HEAT repeat domain-containing protein n=1 Tax=Corallococcus sp. BB11-1 TaxID=2996783 RepID=UPI00226ED532|nr:HEAT repeat domain-containing protein [Corallococcus sp. BB11-1]MCY1036665.1 HEAT repeat domain-containing protein [Corallococcus sp. BB11-1]